MVQNIAKHAIHVITGTRDFYYKKLQEHSSSIQSRTILEFGSGKQVDGEYKYSTKHLFDDSNRFIQTDINPDFGHKVLDITTMNENEAYDVILCLNVLEHVFETKKAIKNLHRALKKDGIAFIAVPVHFPLHDEPHDYWRFTEHALRRLLKDFKKIAVHHKGHRKFPFGYFVVAYK